MRFTLLVLIALLAAACQRAESASAASAMNGAALYLEHGCAACHGRAGRGDGPSARTTALEPRDFANPKSYRRGTSVGSIAQSIHDGVPGAGGGMPSFAHIPADERRAIARYIVSLQRSQKESS